MKQTATLRTFYLAFAFLLASVLPAAAVNAENKPKHGSLSCPVNASAGKKAKTKTTRIRKKGKPGKVKKAPAPKIQKQAKAKTAKAPAQKAQKQSTAKPAKAPKVKSPKQQKTKSYRPKSRFRSFRKEETTSFKQSRML